MLTDEEIIEIIKKLDDVKPKKMLDQQHVNLEGTMLALVYIYRKEGEVSAGELSRELKVSTARIAVLVRKMQEKGYVTRKVDEEDGRRAVIDITDKGRALIEKHKIEFFETMRALADKVGKDRFMEFFDILYEMHGILEERREKYRNEKDIQ